MLEVAPERGRHAPSIPDPKIYDFLPDVPASGEQAFSDKPGQEH
jgi:hypothetical protein